MEPAAPAPSAKAGRRPRDMALSLLVLLVPVFLIVGFYRFLGNETPPPVDPAPVYESARRAGVFPVLTPQGLPKGWRIATADFRSGTLRIGVTTDADGAMQVVQSASAVDTVVSKEVGAGARVGEPFDVEGVAWRRYTDGRPGERAIVLTGTPEAPGRTVVVVGKATDTELRTLAAALR